MTRLYALSIRETIFRLSCYSERDLGKLLSYSDSIKEVAFFMDNKKGVSLPNMDMSYDQLLESERYLSVWVNKPDKKTMYSTFNQGKRDFLDILDGYIKYGEAHGLWEQPL